MSKRTVFTTITALPAGITRETVIETLHNHFDMIDLNPLVIERHRIKAPRKASSEEYHSAWYHVVDKINYFPGYQGRTEFDVCFHDLTNGLQTHCYAPLGLDIRDKWTLGGTLPHEPKQPVEIGIGVPKDGLWYINSREYFELAHRVLTRFCGRLREDVDMKCNMIATGFVKKTLKKAHGTLVERLVEKAHIEESKIHNSRLEERNSVLAYYSETQTPGSANHSSFPGPTHGDRVSMNPYPNQWQEQRPDEQRGSMSNHSFPYNPAPEKLQQPLVDSGYYQPPNEGKHPQLSPDLRYSQSPPRHQDSRPSYHTYEPHQAAELPQNAPTIAELPSSDARRDKDHSY